MVLANGSVNSGMAAVVFGVFLFVLNAIEWRSDSGLLWSNRRIVRARRRRDTDGDDRWTRHKADRTRSGMAIGLLSVVTGVCMIAYGLLTG